MTKRKTVTMKKDRALPKQVPKSELSVGETAYLARLMSLTREWFNELAPGIHQHHLHNPCPTSYNKLKHSHITVPPYPQHIITQRRREESPYSTIGTHGKTPVHSPGVFSIGTASSSLFFYHRHYARNIHTPVQSPDVFSIGTPTSKKITKHTPNLTTRKRTTTSNFLAAELQQLITMSGLNRYKPSAGFFSLSMTGLSQKMP